MDTKNEIKPTTNAVKVFKVNSKQNDETELDIIVAYAQMVFHTLKNSATEITPKSIKAEVKMFYEKFGNKEVKRLANLIVKEKKQNG